MTAINAYPLTLTGKYFINQESHGDNVTALLRGRILGPVADSDQISLPFYLCEIWPPDTATLVMRSQTILALPQLCNAWLYDDEALFVEEWRKLQVDIRKAQDRQRRAAIAQRKRVEQALRAGGVRLPDGRMVQLVDPQAGGPPAAGQRRSVDDGGADQ